MPGLNRVQLIGRLGKDPESRSTPSGRKVTQFSLAVDRRWKDRSGEARTATEWVTITAWGRLGEICQQYLHKGSLAYIEGRLQTDKFEDKGETKWFTKVVASSMQMLDKKSAEEPAEDGMLEVEEEAGEYEVMK